MLKVVLYYSMFVLDDDSKITLSRTKRYLCNATALSKSERAVTAYVLTLVNVEF